MADLIYSLGMDDAEFRAALARSENDVSRVAGRVGAAINAQTQGVNRLVRSIRGVSTAAFGVLGVVGMITGAFVLMSRATDYLWTADTRRLKRMQEINRELRQSMATLREMAGIRLSAEQEIEAQVARNFQLLAASRPGTQSRFFGLVQERTAGIGPTAELVLRQEILRLRERALEVLDEERRRSAFSLAESVKLDLLRAQGDEIGVLIEQERQRHAQRLRQIDEIRENNAGMADIIEEAENRRHRRTMDNIEQERQARQKAEADRLAAQRFEFDMLEAMQAAERARLLGQEDYGRQIELEAEHRRRIRDIERMEGISDDEKRRLIEQERQLLHLRLAELANTAAIQQSRPDTIGLEARGFADRGLRAQVFGNPERVLLDRQNAERQEIIKREVMGIKEIMRNGIRVQGVLV